MDSKKFEKLYRENPEAPASEIIWEFESNRERNAYIDYRTARKGGSSHAEAIEILMKLQAQHGHHAFYRPISEPRHPEAMDAGDNQARASILEESDWGEDNELDEQFWNRDA